MSKEALEIAILAIQKVLNDEETTEEEMEEIVSSPILERKDNNSFAGIVHLAFHFVIDRDLRFEDAEYDQADRERLTEELQKLQEMSKLR